MQWAYHMILPWATFAILFAALYVRLIRANVMETMNEDYVRTARAKGAPESQVMRSHVLRNSMLPVVTILGMDIGLALGGAIFTESIYSLPGLGRQVLQSYENFDLPVILGIVVFSTLCIILFNLIVDLLYAVIDPRIRLDLMAAPRGPGPADELPHRRRHRQGGRRRQLLGREGEDARDRRRVRLRQERHLPHDHGPEQPAQHDLDRRGALQRRGPAADEPRAGCARSAATRSR